MKITRNDKGSDGSFVLFIDEKKAGELVFSRREDGCLVVEHTEVDPGYSGQGLGKKLVLAAVAYAREQKLKINPLCPYAKRVIEQSPDLRNILG